MADADSDRRGPVSPLVAQVVSEAIARAGKALALAAKIQPLVGRTYADRTVSAWGRGDVMPPADAVLAAAKVTGISLDEKLGVGREPTEIERQLAALEQRVQELARRVDDRDLAPGGTLPAGDLDRMGRLLASLEDEMARVGTALRRRWEEPVAPPEVRPMVSPEEHLRRRVGTLRTRMLEVRDILGLEWRQGYPPEPATSAERGDVVDWVGRMVRLLDEQVREVSAHPRVARGHEEHERAQQDGG